MLAGLVQAPSRLAPTRTRPCRRTHAIGAERDGATGYLCPKRSETAPAHRCAIGNTLPTGTYFADWRCPSAQIEQSAIRANDHGDARCAVTERWRGVTSGAGVGQAQVARSRCAPTARLSRWSAAKLCCLAVQPRDPGAGASRIDVKLFVYLAALR